MRIRFESVGGFTGPAGREVIDVDLSSLPAPQEERLLGLLRRVPVAAWGSQLFVEHPRSSDFRNTLQVSRPDGKRSVEFHMRAAPDELRALVAELRAAKGQSGSAE